MKSFSLSIVLCRCVCCVVNCYCGGYSVGIDVRNGGFVSDGNCHYFDFV